MSLEDVQARLAQAEQKAQEAEGLAVALKEKGDTLATVEGQLAEERTAREGAQSQLTLKDTALAEAQVQLEREHKALEEVRAQLTQAAEKAREIEQTGAALQETQSQLQLAREELGGVRDTLQRRDASISQLQQDVDAARAALETEKKRAEELQKSAADPSGEMQSLQVAYNEAQGELKALEAAALEVCRELEGAEGEASGSSIASRLRSLGSRVTERLRGALRLGVQKTLALTLTHYVVDFGLLRDGYVLPEDVVGEDAELEVVRRVDASMAEPAAALADMFEVDLFPDAVEGEAAAAPSPHAS